MGVDGVTPVDVAKTFQPSTENVSRPAPSQDQEAILKIFDAMPKSHTKLRSNHLGHGMQPQLDFTA